MSMTIGEGGQLVEVVFAIPDAAAGEAALVGEFNGWSPTANPMQHEDGGFVATVTLQRGRRYRFRYLLDGSRWENDWAADGYEPNEFGGDDSVIDLTKPTKSATTPASW
jgi:1,4-alpha-glucan branching enzyme